MPASTGRSCACTDSPTPAARSCPRHRDSCSASTAAEHHHLAERKQRRHALALLADGPANGPATPAVEAQPIGDGVEASPPVAIAALAVRRRRPRGCSAISRRRPRAIAAAMASRSESSRWRGVHQRQADGKGVALGGERVEARRPDRSASMRFSDKRASAMSRPSAEPRDVPRHARLEVLSRHRPRHPAAELADVMAEAEIVAQRDVAGRAAPDRPGRRSRRHSSGTAAPEPSTTSTRSSRTVLKRAARLPSRTGASCRASAAVLTMTSSARFGTGTPGGSTSPTLGLERLRVGDRERRQGCRPRRSEHAAPAPGRRSALWRWRARSDPGPARGRRCSRPACL